jgi:hypothetical protein
MEKHFVTYEQALALKELGFDEPCLGFYDDQYNKDNSFYINDSFNQNKRLIYTSAPLKSQVFEWFRKEHGLHIGICHAVNNKFDCWTNNGNLLDGGEYCDFETYEEAESVCINKLIEILQK